MSDLPVRRGPPGIAVPTGPALLALVRAQQVVVLAARQEGRLEDYKQERDFYIFLLSIAQNDTYCAPILITEAQTVFDEEHRDYVNRRRG